MAAAVRWYQGTAGGGWGSRLSEIAPRGGPAMSESAFTPAITHGHFYHCSGL